MTLDFRGKHPDRFYAKYCGGRYKVIADGRELKDCFYYDGRRRIIGFYLRNAQGQYYLTDDKKDVARKFIKARRVRLVKKTE